MRPRAPGLALVVGCACAAACSYDWSTGAAPRDGGDAHEADAGDGGVHADASDGAIDRETGDAPVGMDVEADGPDCNQLHANVDAARVKARQCTAQPSDCMSKVTDQCGCEVYVAQASSQATSDYEAAINALQDSGCTLGCGSCTTPQPAQCLPSMGPDGGLSTSCSP